MNRRQFLQSALGLPFASLPKPGTRYAIIADLQMWRAEIEAMLPLISARPVEFVIVAGDVCDVYPEGSDIDANWQWTVSQLDAMGKPWYAVPGNHDLDQRIGSQDYHDNQAPRSAWARYVGPANFARNTTNSRIVGVECQYWDYGWIAAQFAGYTGRRVVVSHYPLAGVAPMWSYPEMADRLAFLQAIGVDWYFSGHRHQAIACQAGALRLVTVPAVSYVYGANLPDPVPGGILPFSVPMLGWLEVEDGPGGVAVELYRADGERVWRYAPGGVWLPFVAR